jgi:hypothetical protein
MFTFCRFCKSNYYLMIKIQIVTTTQITFCRFCKSNYYLMIKLQ